MLEIGSLAFATPWMLSALLLLPLLWWLLRVTPPAPRHIRFPAIRLLFGLESPEKTPASSPWWLILLRLLAVTALILGLAHPLINPSAQLSGQGPVLMVVDDGWASASRWAQRQEAMRHIVTQAERESRGVILVTTAPAPDTGKPLMTGALKPNDARGRIDALRPKPWASDRDAAISALEAMEARGSIPVVWLSDGIFDDATSNMFRTLNRYGPVRLLRDAEADLPLLLVPSSEADARLAARVRRPAAGLEDRVTVRALAEDGRILGSEAAEFSADATEAEASFDFPTEVRNEVSRFDIESEASAAAVVLLDERWRRRPVGLVSEKPLDSGPALLSETYYLDRALRPFSDVRHGTVSELVKARRAVIILPDEHAPNPGEIGALTQWVENGGLLLRFAGPRLARDQADELTPVRLRRGGRALGGALLWSKPARLAPFSSESPFAGLEIPKDVTVSRQVLAEPSLDLAEKTWVRLTDGTPLVTAERREKGRIVLVHTTANTTWTSLPLSGLFVDMLRRTIAISRGVAEENTGERPLPPLDLLDGFGRSAKPTAAATAIAAGGFSTAEIGPLHPPGYYGAGDTRQALNLGPQIEGITALADIPPTVQSDFYAQSNEFNIKPWLLLVCLVLLLIDIIATLALRGLLVDALLLRRLRITGARGTAALAALLAAGMTLHPADTAAQQSSAQDQFALEASSATRLAYVITGSDEVDSVSQAGLVGLSNVLNQRTAVETGQPIGIDLVQDELVFFSLIYWPVTARQSALNAETIAKLNRFLENGGTVLFDTRDSNVSSGGGSPQATALRRITRGLNLPPVEPVPPNHVLTKAFYLMQEFPGRWSGGRVWVERGDARTNDGVSRIIAGGHDWAAAWAIDEAGRPMFPVVPGGERQREMAYRFGVNLVMYTLTGNYKSDQVHVPAILERLGQ